MISIFLLASGPKNYLDFRERDPKSVFESVARDDPLLIEIRAKLMQS